MRLLSFVYYFFLKYFKRGGRFSDGWGSCEKREKRFNKPNHDIPSTAETRAKNKACQVSAKKKKILLHLCFSNRLQMI
jgi:hypothetical protein